MTFREIFEQANIVINTCPTCRRPVYYEKWQGGELKFHTETDEFNCPED